MADTDRAKRVSAVRNTIAVIGIVALLGLGAGCRSDVAQHAGNRPATLTDSCRPKADTVQYFPPGVLEPDDSDERWGREELYVSVLRAMDEPSIFCSPATERVFRLTRLEWTGTPVAVRITKRSDQAELSVAKLEAPSWKQPPGRVTARRSSSISGGEWAAVERALIDASFWSLPSFESRRGIDGAGTAWIIEGRVGSEYHVVNRSSPGAGAYRTAGELLLRLAGVTEAELSGASEVMPNRPPR